MSDWTDPPDWPGDDPGAGPADDSGPDEHGSDHVGGEPVDVDDAGVDELVGPIGSTGPDPAGDDAVAWMADEPTDDEPAGHDAASGPDLAPDADSGDWAETLLSATPAAGSAADPWAELIGVGAVDPSGAQPWTFAGADLDVTPDTGPLASDPDWLVGHDFDAGDWARAELLADATPAPAQPDDGAAAVTELWQRLSPGTPLPTTDAGAPDLAGALDVLGHRGTDPALQQVVETARRQLET